MTEPTSLQPETAQASPRRRRRWLRWIGIIVLVIVAAGAGFGFYIWHVTGVVPDFYLRKLTGEQRLEVLASVERKVGNFQDALGQAVSDAANAGGSATTPAGDTREPARLALTADELDAYFNKWLDDNDYRKRFETHLEGPRLAIVDGKLVLAGRLKSFRNSVVSFRFKPDVNEEDKTQLTFEGAYAGSLSLPQAALDAFRERARDAIAENLPEREAEVREEEASTPPAPPTSSPGDAITGDLMRLAVDRQLLALLDLEPVENLVVFPPLLGHGSIACRVVELSIEDGELVVGLIPLTAAEREEMVADLQKPEKTESASAS